MSTSGDNTKAYSALAAYLRGGRLPHAILLEGGDPAALDAFTRRLAAGALCTAAPELRPCGACRDCAKADKGIHPDILDYRGKGGSLSFHIGDVRELRREAYVRPNEGRCKVLILHDVQDMTVQASNALLKILEEPPAGVIFVLTCENKSVLLDTILSRVAVIALGSPAAPQIDEDNVESGQALAILQALCLGSELDALAALGAYERDKEKLSLLLEHMARHVQALPGRAPEQEDEIMQRLRARIPPLRLMQILAIIEEILDCVPQNVNRLVLITNLCAKIKLALSH